MQTRNLVRRVGYLVLLALGFWFVSFYLNPFNFWLEMSVAVFALAGLSLLVWDSYDQLVEWTVGDVLLGASSALVLYGIFWLGNYAITRIIPFAETEIAAVYSNSGSAAIPIIGTLLVLVIGPGEEIFWRGTVQKTIEDKYGKLIGLMAGAGLYSIVHVWALNLTLLLAALVCGVVWGYMYYRKRSLAPVIVSHSLWSLLIFVIIPV